MTIPKYIITKFYQRAKYGLLVDKLDVEIMEWCKKQGVNPIEVFESPYSPNSIMLLAEPTTLSRQQIEIIKNLLEDNNDNQ